MIHSQSGSGLTDPISISRRGSTHRLSASIGEEDVGVTGDTDLTTPGPIQGGDVLQDRIRARRILQPSSFYGINSRVEKCFLAYDDDTLLYACGNNLILQAIDENKFYILPENDDLRIIMSLSLEPKNGILVVTGLDWNFKLCVVFYHIRGIQLSDPPSIKSKFKKARTFRLSLREEYNDLPGYPENNKTSSNSNYSKNSNTAGTGIVEDDDLTQGSLSSSFRSLQNGSINSTNNSFLNVAFATNHQNNNSDSSEDSTFSLNKELSLACSDFSDTLQSPRVCDFLILIPNDTNLPKKVFRAVNLAFSEISVFQHIMRNKSLKLCEFRILWGFAHFLLIHVTH